MQVGRGRVCGVGPVRVVVVAGVRGEVVEGVSRVLSEVFSVSSVREREVRRKVERAVGWKQNWGWRCAWGVGLGIVGFRVEVGWWWRRGGEVVVVQGEAQNHASLVDCVVSVDMGKVVCS